MIVGGFCQNNQQSLGGKGFHLGLLLQGGFEIPKTFYPANILDLPDNEQLYVVRSSADGEDNHTKTSAGKFLTLKGVKKAGLAAAVREVQSHYSGGNVIIQFDLSSRMEFSGVIYSNLNGVCVISAGKKNFVQKIVDGEPSETEVLLSNKRLFARGLPVNPGLIRRICAKSQEIEDYFGIPTDIEFAIINAEMISLQARPLPNPTEYALREHELRRLNKQINHLKEKGLDEVVLGVGNYREILANSNATHLSTSTFNYVFAGNGKDTFGAVQLGRNELGYDIGTEIFPWVIMLNGKVYYNFAGDALQFRPKGTKEEDLLRIINEVYIPIARGDADLLNYPELRLYIQFPEQAEAVGLDPAPFRDLAERNRKAINDIQTPLKPPVKRTAEKYCSIDKCLNEITATVESIRMGSAKEYVKAARLAFFALEDIRIYLAKIKESQPSAFKELSDLFEAKSPEQLRDAVIYDESIGSFELAESEEFRYLGSFELSQPRGFPSNRHFKKGRSIPEETLATMVSETRIVLEHREKVKFALFRDYDYLKQLYEQAGQLSGFGEEIYYLELDEINYLIDKPRLAMYRIELRKIIKAKNLLPDPLFESDLECCVRRVYEKRPQLIFGSLPQKPMCVTIGEGGYLVDSVDQTTAIPAQTSIVFVADNVRPGSHLFTVLSDYSLPVVGVPQEDLNKMKGCKFLVSLKKGYVNIQRQE